MAKYTSLFELQGTLSGVNFYMRQGVPIARKAGGGFTGKAIRNQENMQKVRENASEFGNCSRVKKVFNSGISPFLEGYKDVSLHGRMMGLFTKLKSYDLVHAPGERQVATGLQTSIGRQLLTQFEITLDCRMLNSLLIGFAFDWKTQCLTLPHVVVSDLEFISGATHFEIRLGFLDMCFEPLGSDFTLTDSLLFDKDAVAGCYSLKPKTVISGAGLLIAVVGLRFYQCIDGVYYDLKSKIGVRVLGVDF